MDGIFTTASNSGKGEELTAEHLEKLMDKIGVPQSLVLFPAGGQYEVYQFDAVLLKGVISFIQNRKELVQNRPTKQSAKPCSECKYRTGTVKCLSCFFNSGSYNFEPEQGIAH